MSQLLLLLRLEGPLQSWGLRARWDVRDTGEEPTKSGIIGLLGSALGYPVGDPRLEDLDRVLSLGVRTEHAGRVLLDYQTVTGVIPTAEGGAKGRREDPATIVSPRAYLQDAAFLAVLAGPAETLETCRQALSSPRWPAFLGRKSCPPTRPILEGLTSDYESLEAALRGVPWRWEGRESLRSLPSELRCVMEDEKGEAIRPDRIRVNPARMYDTRRVRVFWTAFPGEGRSAACTCRGSF